MPRKQAFLLAAKLIFSAILLWIVLRKLDVAGITSRLLAANPRWLLASLSLGPVVLVLSAWRWQTLSLSLLGFSEAVRYTWIGLFFGTVMPGMIGGDVAKGIALATKESRTRDARLPVSIIADKLIGLWVLLLMFCLVALVILRMQPQLLAELRGALWVTCLATGAGLLLGIAIVHPRGAAQSTALIARLPAGKLRAGAEHALAALESFRGQSRVLWRAAFISMAIHLLNVVGIWIVMHSLAIPASLLFAAVFYPTLSVLLALPVSVSGVGVRDVFAASMFTAFALNPESGVALSWLLLGLSIPNALVGGVIQLWEMFRRQKKAVA